jgi:hypothetical protein
MDIIYQLPLPDVVCDKIFGYACKSPHSGLGAAVLKKLIGSDICAIIECLTSIIEHLEIQRKEDIIIDHNSGNTLHEEDFVSMNYWVCNESIFYYLEEYIIKMHNQLENIEKDEIYLPFAAQNLLQDNTIEIKVIDSQSKWFGVTYAEDILAEVKNL